MMINDDDDISTQPVLSDARACGGQGVSFPASPLCLRYGAHAKLHPPVRKRRMPIRLHRKCARTFISHRTFGKWARLVLITFLS
jgi:hypothetical protein